MAEAVRILIAGTGTVGTSIGLALQRSGMPFDRVGYDPHGPRAQQAQKSGAVDRVVSQPGRAGAVSLVIVALPPSRALAVVEALAGSLPSETVVLCATPVSSQAFEEMRRRLGSTNACLLTVPFVGAERVLQAEGDSAPSADIFAGGLLAIVAPAGTPQPAIELSLDLASVLETKPFFLDPAELDSVTATCEHLPALLAAATLTSLPANPGWRDQQRLVGETFARFVGILQGTPPELAASWIGTRGPLLARLDALAEELTALREALATGDEAAVATRLESAGAHDREWRLARASAQPDVPTDAPSVPRTSLFDRLLGGGPSKKN